MQSSQSVHPKPPPNIPKGALPTIPSDVDGPLPQFAQTIQQNFARPGVRINDRLVAALTAGCSAFDMDYGLITHVDDGQLSVVVTAQVAAIPAPVSKGTTRYFSHTIIEDHEWLLIDGSKACAQSGQLDQTGIVPKRFVGFPLVFDGQIYGTVEFSATGAGRAFDDRDRMAMYLLSTVLAIPLALLSDY